MAYLTPLRDENPMMALLDDIARLAAELQSDGLLDDWNPVQDGRTGWRFSDSQK